MTNLDQYQDKTLISGWKAIIKAITLKMFKLMALLIIVFNQNRSFGAETETKPSFWGVSAETLAKDIFKPL